MNFSGIATIRSAQIRKFPLETSSNRYPQLPNLIRYPSSTFQCSSQKNPLEVIQSAAKRYALKTRNSRKHIKTHFHVKLELALMLLLIAACATEEISIMEYSSHDCIYVSFFFRYECMISLVIPCIHDSLLLLMIKFDLIFMCADCAIERSNTQKKKFPLHSHSLALYRLAIAASSFSHFLHNEITM